MKILRIEAFPQDPSCKDPAQSKEVIDFLAEVPYNNSLYNYCRVTYGTITVVQIKELAHKHNVVINICQEEVILDLYNDQW